MQNCRRDTKATASHCDTPNVHGRGWNGPLSNHLPNTKQVVPSNSMLDSGSVPECAHSVSKGLKGYASWRVVVPF